MLITYRRTGGVFMLLIFAAAALAATVLTVAVTGILLIIAAAIAAVGLFGRAVLPGRWRNRTVLPETRWPGETIEATVIHTDGNAR